LFYAILHKFLVRRAKDLKKTEMVLTIAAKNFLAIFVSKSIASPKIILYQRNDAPNKHTATLHILYYSRHSTVDNNRE